MCRCVRVVVSVHMLGCIWCSMVVVACRYGCVVVGINPNTDSQTHVTGSLDPEPKGVCVCVCVCLCVYARVRINVLGWERERQRQGVYLQYA